MIRASGAIDRGRRGMPCAGGPFPIEPRHGLVHGARMFTRWSKPLLRASVLSALLAGAVFGAATEWPEFRGPDRQGRSQARNIPVTWSATENIAWAVPVEGSGWSSPVIVQGRLFLTSATGGTGTEPLRLKVLGFDAATGKTRWTTSVFEHDLGKLPSIHGKNGQASPTVLVDPSKKRLYAHFGHLGTAALDFNGRVLWRQSEIQYTPIHGNGGSPALVDGLLVFSCDGGNDPFVVALDAATGQVRWKTPRNTTAKRTFSFATPLVETVAKKQQIILPGSGFVAGYQPGDGRELWRVRYGEGYSVIPRPVLSEGILIIGTGYDTPSLLGIRLDQPQGDVTDSAIAWRITKGAPNTPSVIAHQSHVYFVSDAGIASCAELATGKIVWNERLGGGFSASPILAEGRIYFINEAGLTTVVKASPTFEVVARNDLAERTLASPAVIDGSLFIRSAGTLRRIGKPASR